eukprot:scaffold185422_cov91-Cyclotella_meneghiniana.AAC.3
MLRTGGPIKLKVLGSSSTQRSTCGMGMGWRCPMSLLISLPGDPHFHGNFPPERHRWRWMMEVERPAAILPLLTLP